MFREMIWKMDGIVAGSRNLMGLMDVLDFVQRFSEVHVRRDLEV